jgi:hypothetical protein
MPNMPYFTNKLLVRLAIQPSGPGTAITPVGSGTFDSTTNIATLTYDGANSSDNGTTDWLIVAGIDLNGDGVLQASEVATQAADKIRAVTSTAYNTDLAFLILGENTIGRFIQPDAGDFLRAFVNDEAVDGATATTTTIQVNATAPQPLSVNVGALFQPNGAGSIRNNVFPADGILAIDIESSATFLAYVTNILASHHAEVDAYFAANPTSAPHQFGPWTGPTALALTDDDLIDTLDNVTANLTVTVTVANTKVAQSIATTGTISDLYNFTWPDTRTGDGSIAEDTLISGISVQAGYNTLGSGGHIFTSLININALGDVSAGFNYTFQ